MNERIRLLVEQAGINFDKDLSDIDVCVMLPSDLEKFAQLIVEECAELNRKQSYNIMGVLVDMAEPNAEFDRVCLNTVNHVHTYLSGNALKRYFGFEE
jgi:hypothetical protein